LDEERSPGGQTFEQGDENGGMTDDRAHSQYTNSRNIDRLARLRRMRGLERLVDTVAADHNDLSRRDCGSEASCADTPEKIAAI